MSDTKSNGKLEKDKNKIKAHKISKQQIISQKSENQKTKSITSSPGQDNLDGQLSNQLKLSNIIKYGLIKKAKEDNLNQVKDILREKLIYKIYHQVVKQQIENQQQPLLDNQIMETQKPQTSDTTCLTSTLNQIKTENKLNKHDLINKRNEVLSKLKAQKLNHNKIMNNIQNNVEINNATLETKIQNNQNNQHHQHNQIKQPMTQFPDMNTMNTMNTMNAMNTMNTNDPIKMLNGHPQQQQQQFGHNFPYSQKSQHHPHHQSHVQPNQMMNQLNQINTNQQYSSQEIAPFLHQNQHHQHHQHIQYPNQYGSSNQKQHHNLHQGYQTGQPQSSSNQTFQNMTTLSQQFNLPVQDPMANGNGQNNQNIHNNQNMHNNQMLYSNQDFGNNMMMDPYSQQVINQSTNGIFNQNQLNYSHTPQNQIQFNQRQTTPPQMYQHTYQSSYYGIPNTNYSNYSRSHTTRQKYRSRHR